MKKINYKEQRGVTIIALTVTIIVLLILAGISISLLTGDSDLIGKSEQSKIETEIRQYQEKLEILKQLESTNNYTADVDQFMANYVEVVAKDAMFKENKGITPDTDRKLVTIVTKEGYEFEVTMDDVIYVGDKGEGGDDTGDGENNQEVPGVTFSTDYGTIDVIWLDTNNNVISKPNVPQLTSNGESLIPIKWDASNNIVETTASDTNWYNYDENRWANAKTKNESYFVWIPRYAYRITYYESEYSNKITGYYDGRGQWKAETGEVRVALDKGIETVDYNGQKYIVHPAFETNLDNGGWDKDIEGMWVAKFEANFETKLVDMNVTIEVKFTNGVKSIKNKTIGKFYESARQATYGYIGQQGEDGNKSFMNSHMMKNSEWGAVGYLAHSKYGRNGNKIDASTNPMYTGGGTGEAYKINISQSTTGNVYGIYDLVGGNYEYVAAYNSADKNSCFLVSDWTKLTKLIPESTSTKYATKYYNITDDYYGNNIIYSYAKIGDAIKEVNIGGKKYKNDKDYMPSWFSGRTGIINSYQPFFMRGGNSIEGPGIFSSGKYTGENSEDYTFRAVLIKN